MSVVLTLLHVSACVLLQLNYCLLLQLFADSLVQGSQDQPEDMDAS